METRVNGRENHGSLARLLGLLLLGVLASCASDGSTPTEQPRGGSLWDRLEANRGKRAQEVDLAAGAKDLPPGWKETIDESWAVWRKSPADIDPMLANRGGMPADPARLSLAQQRLEAEWSLARGRWLALGPGAENLLAENLIRWFVLSFDASNGYEVNRARVEMARMKDAVRPYLIEGLAISAGDSVTRARLAELLGYLGGGTAEVQRAYGRASSKGKIELARALKAMKDPDSREFLMEIADSGDPWQARADALTTLGVLGDPRSSDTFIECLRDSDESVRKFAALHAGSLREPPMSLAQALVNVLERELSRAGETEIARAAANSLSRITGRRHGADVGAWRRTLSAGGN
jgi:hypothetical protein